MKSTIANMYASVGFFFLIQIQPAPPGHTGRLIVGLGSSTPSRRRPNAGTTPATVGRWQTQGCRSPDREQAAPPVVWGKVRLPVALRHV